MQQVEALMSSKNRLTVNLSDDELRYVTRLAEKANVSKAWVIRHAVRDLLDSASNDQQLPLPLAEAFRRGSK